jgi:hypothetical protein
VIARLEIAPSPVIGSGGVDGTVTLIAARPESLAVELSSSDDAAVVPQTVTVPAGSTTATFRIPTRPVLQDVDVTITAAAAGHTVTAPVRVLGPRLKEITFTPPEIGGGIEGRVTVQLNGTVGIGGPPMRVELSSSDPAISPPATLTVPERQMTTASELTTRSVMAPTTVTVTGRIGNDSRAVTVRVWPVFMSFVAESGEPTTGGGSRRIAPDTGFQFRGPSKNDFVVIGATGGSSWGLTLQADGVSPLRPGHYVKQGNNPVADIQFSQSGLSCTTGTSGEFDITEAQYDADRIVRFRATFRQVCRSKTVTGEVWVASLPPYP